MTKRKTASVLKLEGTYRKDRHSDRLDEVPASDPPECPSQLSGEAAKEWKRVTKEMQASGYLHSLNRALLTQYCLLWEQLLASLSGEGELNAAFHNSFRLVSSDLGFTPNSMLKMPKKEKPKESGFKRL